MLVLANLDKVISGNCLVKCCSELKKMTEAAPGLGVLVEVGFSLIPLYQGFGGPTAEGETG